MVNAPCEESSIARHKAFESNKEKWRRLRNIVKREIEKAKTNHHAERI